MDLKAVGLRIKTAREAKGLTQENLAALVDLSSTHISVIERGMKTVRLDTFVAIANALDVSADTLLVDVVTHSVNGLANGLPEAIRTLPPDEQKRLMKALKAYLEQEDPYDPLFFLSFFVESSRTKSVSFQSFICYICSKEQYINLWR